MPPKTVAASWVEHAFPASRWLPRVTRSTLRADLIAALTGAIIVLPQAVAFATIAGLPPEYGLYAAMVPAIVAALWGSSWHLVSGPTTAISIIVFASLSPLAEPGSTAYVKLALTLTLLAGLIQLAMGVARLGVLVNFISHTVILGFTAGAALLIIASQIKNFFGLDIPREAKIHEVVLHLVTRTGDIKPWVVVVGVATLVVGLLSRRLLPRVPYMIVALVAGSIVAVLIGRFHSPELSGIRTVGALDATIPPFSLPDLTPGAVQQTLFPAAIIALLGLTEALAIARSIALKSGQRIDSNQEFIGQGLSNVAGSFFSGFASSGSFNRSGVNYTSGARTPLAAALSAVFLLLILLVVAPLAAYLPVPAMAAILFIVGWSLIDLRHITDIVRRHPRERIVFFVTFIGTLIDLERGIFLGLLVSLVFYLYRTSKPTIREMLPAATSMEDHRRKFVPAEPEDTRCPQMTMMRIEGSIYFGAVDYVARNFRWVDETDPLKKTVMVFARPVAFIDRAGADLLAEEAQRRAALGGGLYLVGAQPELREMLERSGKAPVIGADHLFASKGEAIHAIYPRLDSSICATCTSRIFHECQYELPDGTSRSAAQSSAGRPAYVSRPEAPPAPDHESSSTTASAEVGMVTDSPVSRPTSSSTAGL